MNMKENGKACETCLSLCCTRIENFGVVLDGVQVIENVNIHIHCGELTVIIGPNGAGKSTLLKAIVGEVQHTGELKFAHSNRRKPGRPIIGYVPQQLYFDPGLPVSVLDFFAAARSNVPVWLLHPRSVRENVLKMLDRFQIGHVIDRKLGTLSGGELQRVMLALALDPMPDLLMLDEPVSGIDKSGMELFYHMVSELRKVYDLSIILVSHDLPLVAKYADRVIFLNRTVQCIGTAEEVFASEVFIKTFGNIYQDKRHIDKEANDCQ